MTIDIGALSKLYIGLEATAGTAVAATDILPLKEPSGLQDKHEPIPVMTGLGNRGIDKDSVQGKRWTEGPIETYLDIHNSAYLMKLGLGNEVVTNVGGAAYDHNFYPTISGNTPKSATFYHVRGNSTDLERIDFGIVQSLDINFEDAEATMSATLMGKFPQDGAAEPALTVTSGTIFSFRDATLKFGTDLSDAGGNSATPVNTFNLTIENDTERIHRSNEGDVSSYRTKGFKVTGSYEVFFTDTSERNKFRALTKKAMLVQFDGIAIDGSFDERVQLRIAKLRLDESEVSGGLEDFLVVAGQFTAEEDTTQNPNKFDAVWRNAKTDVY